MKIENAITIGIGLVAVGLAAGAVFLGGCKLGAEPAKEPPKPAAAAPAPEGPAKDAPCFTAGPVVTRAEPGWTIRFAVNRPTDVTVAVVAPDGQIVRHLAAGLLGEKAPPPLAEGRLDQTIAWDGRDDRGRDVPRGCSVTVTLASRPEFDRLIPIQEPAVFARAIVGLTTTADGELYVLQGYAWERQVGSPELVVFGRDGKYRKTVIPFRADLPAGKRPGVADDANFKSNRMANNVPGLRSIYRNTMQVVRCEDGEQRLVIVSGRGAPIEGAKPDRRLIRVGLDGSVDEQLLGPVLPEDLQWGQRFFLAPAADGRTLYLSGGGPQVYSAVWGDRTFKSVLGEAKVSGKDDAHFDQARGMAVDKAGRLLVCDWMNDRIQVYSPDLKLQKSLSVPGPEQVAVNRKTGALYVLSVRDRGAKDVYQSVKPIRWDAFEDKSVVKFRSVEDFAELARCDLPKRKLYLHDAGPIMTLDASGKKPVLWISCVGRIVRGDQLWRIEDEGARLVGKEGAIDSYHFPFGTGAGALAVDRVTGDCIWAGRTSPTILRVDGRTGGVTRLDKMAEALYGRRDPVGYKPWQPVAATFDPEGRVCFRLLGMWSGASNFIVRFNPDQTQAPFAAAAQDRQDKPIDKVKPMKMDGVTGALHVSGPSHGYHSGGLGVAPNGDIYVVDQAPDGLHRGPSERNVMNVFGPDGILKKAAAIPHLTSGAWGPRFDPQGNLYLSESVRPVGRPKEEETIGSLIRFNGVEGELVFGDALKGEAKYEMRRSSPPSR
jgi:streptogramin lyase